MVRRGVRSKGRFSRAKPSYPAGRALGEEWGELSQTDQEYYEECADADKLRHEEELDFVAQGASHLDAPLSWMYPSCGPTTSAGDGIWKMDGHADSQIITCEGIVFATVGLRECALKDGKWYYEITILADCFDCPQFGWALSGFDPTSDVGCGDDDSSYACDGDRGLLWGPGADWSTERRFFPDARWKVGDVVGCALDLDCREIRFSVNGVYDGEEPSFCDIVDVSDAAGYFPALTMCAGQVSVNFGARAFQHRPDGYVAVDRAADPAAEPPPPAPKPLTGAAALLETLDKFKAQNGGVDDPYYAAMRSALEELEIEEREEGS